MTPRTLGLQVFLLKLTISIHFSKIFVIPKFAKQQTITQSLPCPWKESFSFAAMLGDSLSSVEKKVTSVTRCESKQVSFNTQFFNAGNKKALQVSSSFYEDIALGFKRITRLCQKPGVWSGLAPGQSPTSFHPSYRYRLKSNAQV